MLIITTIYQGLVERIKLNHGTIPRMATVKGFWHKHPSSINWNAGPGGTPRASRWLDGNIHELVPDRDYDPAKVDSFRSRLWQLADKRGFKVRTKQQDGFLYVQALDMYGDPKPGAVLVLADGTQVPEPGPEPPQPAQEQSPGRDQ